ncbi:phosphohistidine phosphatase [Salegentibacter salinarum]|uniref:Phosphohistidine phosphatase n=1 Tax=Salegentibacter salinarum TaxID=447422 RepID=A0A2N0TSY5_9FLAO|nr:histidine phosphatase family protein [Salegentibacter salinarum]PKD17862.1 phosphohistidine phosphatase [Salegentibacter salinarum]SKC00855.1 phosphohistidine phosphatase [Salegentibacter salinarum]
MKRLILVRHGKSSWENNLPDDKRPLKKRAYNDAEVVLKTFKEFQSGNLTLWSSPAVRANTTANLFKDELQIPDDRFTVKKELYTFDENQLLSVINTCPNNVEKLMVFGHNPAMTGLVNRLGDKPIDNLPTTGLCVIDFDLDSWKDIKTGKTLLQLFPKNLR